MPPLLPPPPPPAPVAWQITAPVHAPPAQWAPPPPPPGWMPAQLPMTGRRRPAGARKTRSGFAAAPLPGTRQGWRPTVPPLRPAALGSGTLLPPLRAAPEPDGSPGPATLHDRRPLLRTVPGRPASGRRPRRTAAPGTRNRTRSSARNTDASAFTASRPPRNCVAMNPNRAVSDTDEDAREQRGGRRGCGVGAARRAPVDSTRGR